MKLYWLKFFVFLLRDKIKSIRMKYNIFLYARKNNCSLSITSNFTGRLSNLKIGENTVINGNANFRFKKGKITIGSDCLFGQNVTIISNTYVIEGVGTISPQNMYSKDVAIGDNVWIGVNVVIMPGIVIGNNSIVAASAVVTKNIGENEVWAGVPAKLKKRR